MSYSLEAVIASAAVLIAVRPALALVPLGHGLALVPMTDDVFGAFAGGKADSAPGFWRMPGGLARALSAWSSDGPVAYVEADYFGGVGGQCAAVWERGSLAFGPVTLREHEAPPAAGTPISQALARLGVVRDGHLDEFDTVGLGRHRRTEDWCSGG